MQLQYITRLSPHKGPLHPFSYLFSQHIFPEHLLRAKQWGDRDHGEDASMELIMVWLLRQLKQTNIFANCSKCYEATTFEKQIPRKY